MYHLNLPQFSISWKSIKICKVLKEMDTCVKITKCQDEVENNSKTFMYIYLWNLTFFFFCLLYIQVQKVWDSASLPGM